MWGTLMSHDVFFINALVISLQREFKRVLYEPSRLLGMLVQPIIFWLIFSTGFAKTFSYSYENPVNYEQYFFAGMLGLVVLFASIYSTLTLVDDKQQGFFKYMTCSSLGLFPTLLGKILATSLLGFTQSLLFLPFALYLFGLTINIVYLLILLLLGSICFAILGVLFAWISPSSSAFHALMSIFLIPMWLLSEAMFPLKDSFLKVILYINPMSYFVDGLRKIFFLKSHNLNSSIIALLIFSFLLSTLLFRLVIKKHK